MTTTTAAARGEGYVLDIAYPHNFLPVLAPLNLAFVAARGGFCPPDVDGAWRYLDLGCGNGFTPALIAAANPQAHVFANDFNPEHIRTARATAAAADIANVSFVDASFAELLDTPLPLFDFVAVHGIWSWVNAANRDRVAALLQRCVRPGGIVVISYNCRPGWDALLPLRRLLIAAAGADGPPRARIERALAAAQALCDAGADYFRHVPAAARALARLHDADRGYLVHEYLNEHWTLFEPREVFDAAGRAGLDYAGQAKAMDDVDAFWLTPAQTALVDAAGDRAAREATRDLILDRRFRRDVFVRGGGPAGDPAAWLAQRSFVLARPRRSCTAPIATRDGFSAATTRLDDAVLDALTGGVATAAELAATPALAAASVRDIGDTLARLTAMGHVQPALRDSGAAARRAATDRFNAAALAAARQGDTSAALASPITGAGVMLPPLDQLLLDAQRHGVPCDAAGDPAVAANFERHALPALVLLGIA